MTRKTTVKDIAGKLGISSSTVSFVLNGQDKGISKETRQKVIDTAIAMNYRKLPGNNMLGWIRVAYLTQCIEYFNFYTSFFAGVYNYMQRQSAEHKIELSLLEFDLHDKPEIIYLKLQKLREQGIDVFISNSSGIVKYLLQHGLKAVLAQGGTIPECVSVYCDDYSAGKIAGEYALEMGHRIAGTVFPSGSPTARFNGFVEAFNGGGGECPEKFRWTPEFTHDAIIEDIKKRTGSSNKLPSLLYCFADNIVFPVMRGLALNGIKVPEDISLIGTDNLYWGKLTVPAMTTIDLNEELFAEKLLEGIKHTAKGGAPYQLAVPVQLMARETVKRINS